MCDLIKDTIKESRRLILDLISSDKIKTAEDLKKAIEQINAQFAKKPFEIYFISNDRQDFMGVKHVNSKSTKPVWLSLKRRLKKEVGAKSKKFDKNYYLLIEIFDGEILPTSSPDHYIKITQLA